MTESSLEIGQNFNTYEELKASIARFEEVSYVQLYVRSSRSIEAYKKRATKKSTLFAHLPHQRKVDVGEKEQARSLLKLKADQKLVHQHIRTESGKAVSLKDLHNVMGTRRSAVGLNLQDIVTELQKPEGSVTEVLERDGVLEGLFFQRQAWRDIFARYPELVLIDATYKLNNLGMPLYILMAVDGNGESAIAAIWIVKSEDKPTMTAILQFLKAHNDTSATKCFMADQDWTERGVIRQEFPEATLLICLFHTMRSFRREVTEKTMACTQTDKYIYLDILSKLAYAKSEDQYMAHRDSLHQTGNQRLIDYFEKNWHDIREEWVEGVKNNAMHFMNRTNNRLESLNQKIKAVLERNMNLLLFTKELMLCFDSFDQELQRKASRVFQKVSISLYEGKTPLTEYQRYLTPYAFTFVKRQYELSQGVHIPPGSPTSINLNTSEGTISVSTQQCGCGFFKAISLPCRHILALRHLHQLPLFDDVVCGRRWSRDFYQGRLALAEPSAPSLSVRSAAIPSQHERCRMAFQVAQRLSSLASDLPLREFQHALRSLEEIATAWGVGNRVTVQVVDITGNTTASTIQTVGGPVPTPATPDNSSPSSSSDHTAEENVNISSQPDSGTTTASGSEVRVDMRSSSSLHQCSAAEGSAESQPNTGGQPSSRLLKDIRLPIKATFRGRPKGAGTTVIGLPRKRMKLAVGPVPFLEKNCS